MFSVKLNISNFQPLEVVDRGSCGRFIDSYGLYTRALVNNKYLSNVTQCWDNIRSTYMCDIDELSCGSKCLYLSEIHIKSTP